MIKVVTITDSEIDGIKRPRIDVSELNDNRLFMPLGVPVKVADDLTVLVTAEFIEFYSRIIFIEFYSRIIAITEKNIDTYKVVALDDFYCIVFTENGLEYSVPFPEDGKRFASLNEANEICSLLNDGLKYRKLNDTQNN